MKGRMNVADSLAQAWTHMKRMLFPFDLNKWLFLGVIIFLDTLFEGCGGGGGGGDGDSSDGAPVEVADRVNQAKDWVMQNLDILVPVAIVLFVVIVGLVILFAWLQSHGTMMFVRAVARNDASIGVNWGETRRPAFSLFLFRLALTAVGFLALVLLFVVATAGILEEAALGTQEPWPYIAILLPIIILGLCMALPYWLVETLLRNFVAPLMYRSNLTCLDAWRDLGNILQGNVLMVIVFLIIRFAYFIPFVIAAVISGLCTCCIGWLPVVHHTLFAPFYVFDRAYSLYVIESLGEEYRIIHPIPLETIG